MLAIERGNGIPGFLICLEHTVWNVSGMGRKDKGNGEK